MVSKYAKDVHVKSIMQTKPNVLKGVDFAKLKVSSLPKDTLEIYTPIKKTSSPFQTIRKSISSNPLAKYYDYFVFEFNMRKSLRNFGKDFFETENKIPVEFGNISELKEKLKPVIKERLSGTLESLKSSDDISKLLKNNFSYLNKVDSKEKDAVYFLAREKGITPELEKAFNKCLCEESEGFKKILRIINPKSKNPEVLKIEKELRELGVKEVSFADDIEQAKNTKEAVKNLLKTKTPLPDSIFITPFMPNDCGGRAFAGNGNNLVILSHSNITKNASELESRLLAYVKNVPEFKNAPTEYQNRYLNAILNHQSTKDVSHAFYHEIGHLFQNTLKSEFVELSSAEHEIAKSISTYGASDVSEFVPEVFAKLVSGQQINQQQKDLYLKLGGFLPQF